MIIRFTSIQEGASPEANGEISVINADEVTGDLTIIFEGVTPQFEYSRASVSVPLFAAEIKKFIADVRSTGCSVWKLRFAPFIDGRLDKQRIILSHPLPQGKTQVVDVLEECQVKELSEFILSLERRYGRLKGASEALSFK